MGKGGGREGGEGEKKLLTFTNNVFTIYNRDMQASTYLKKSHFKVSLYIILAFNVKNAG